MSSCAMLRAYRRPSSCSLQCVAVDVDPEIVKCYAKFRGELSLLPLSGISFSSLELFCIEFGAWRFGGMQKNDSRSVPEIIKSRSKGGPWVWGASGALLGFKSSKKWAAQMLLGSSWAPLGRFEVQFWPALFLLKGPQFCFFRRKSSNDYIAINI